MSSLHHQHPWDVSPDAARDIQRKLQSFVIAQDVLREPVKTIAGIDVGFRNQFATTRAAVVVLSFPELAVLETAIAEVPTTFPYVPGLLSFREIPAILKVLEKVTIQPDIIFCDGQGYAHPRRFGLACHLGVLLDLPTIGVAKSRYIGTHGELPLDKGRWIPLEADDEVIGAVLRSRRNVRPLYISIGHRITLATAIKWVLACTPKYRLPETTRLADKLASAKGDRRF